MQAAPRLARSALRQAPRTAPSAQQSSHTATFCVASTLPRSSFASYSIPAAHFSFPISHVRGFTSSSRSEAKEPPSNPFEGPQMLEHAPLFERIKEFPEILEAIEKLARLTHEKTGVDLAGGHKPSMSMMLHLARDPDLRDAAQHVMTTLRAAGVEFNPAEAFKALSMMGGEGFENLMGKGLDAYHDKVRKGDSEGEGGDGKGKK
ncbi:hypothetical protein Rt10032_c02g1191 [Rhodotorula toruloides]|uniref:Uncharacterized protein n=1 Tax=Rhodotorula toruloides TaxID=5286 RepID=A0A511KCQ0_RHOTO|nr:hypothetical protein Rt10032_c02g1191 [Rhodotorula toruloides]